MGSSVLLVTEPHVRRYAAVEGSPLAGRAGVTTLAWAPGDQRGEYDRRFDEALADAEAVIASPWSWDCIPAFTPQRWALASQLKVIAGTFDNRFSGLLEVADAAARGVTVVDTSGTMSPTVAEFALAMTLNVMRDIPAAVQVVREGGWPAHPWDQPGFVHGDLTGQRIGLAGYGAINRRYAELLGPFACSLTASDPFVRPHELASAGIARAETLTELAADSEVLVVGIPMTPATRGVISAEVIDALPRGAAIVVVTRMPVVDQMALWRRVEAGEIRAAVDVYDPEPPPADASFRTSPYVLPTPHVAGSTSTAHRRCFTTACADALAVLAGQAPRFAVPARVDRIYRGAGDPA